MSPLLTPKKQADLVRAALEGMGEASLGPDVCAAIRDASSTVGANQRAAKDAKNCLSKAKETVDWATGEVRCATRDGFDEEMAMFASLCIDGGKSPMDAWEASIPTLIFEKAVESMRTGKPVPVDVEKEFYIPDGILASSIASFGDN